MDYLLLKWVHIISSTILFGTGIGSAFFMFMANLRRDVASIAFATRHVVIADYIFTTPAVIIQFITGLALMDLAGFSFKDGWIIAAIALYIFVGLCWVPVVFMQIKMRNKAQIALSRGELLADDYWTLHHWWVVLGSLAFPVVIVIFYLMVFKPSLI